MYPLPFDPQPTRLHGHRTPLSQSCRSGLLISSWGLHASHTNAGQNHPPATLHKLLQIARKGWERPETLDAAEVAPTEAMRGVVMGCYWEPRGCKLTPCWLHVGQPCIRPSLICTTVVPSRSKSELQGMNLHITENLFNGVETGNSHTCTV